jgi:hypothetical protein
LKETNAQTVKEFSYKFLIFKKGRFSFMLKNNAKVFLGFVDFTKMPRVGPLKVLENN